MGKRVRSARGEMVDFDLLKIKEQMTSAPAPVDVRARQDFIDQRMRRRLKKTKPIAHKIEGEDKNVNVDKKMPGTEELSEETKMIEQEPEQEMETQVTESPKQKARPPKKTTKEGE